MHITLLKLDENNTATRSAVSYVTVSDFNYLACIRIRLMVLVNLESSQRFNVCLMISALSSLKLVS